MNTPETNSDEIGRGLTDSEARTLERLSMITIACVVYFAVALALLHVLQPQFDPVKRAMSNYARGSYGFLFTLAILSIPVMMVSLGTGVHRTLARPIWSRLRLIPAGIAGLGFLLVAIFPMSSTVDSSAAANPFIGHDIVTTADRIHGRAGLIAMLWVLFVMVFYSYRFRTEPRWQPFARSSMALALAAFATFVAGLIVLAYGLPVAGALQRMLYAFMLLWSLLAALRLRAIAK